MKLFISLCVCYTVTMLWLFYDIRLFQERHVSLTNRRLLHKINQDKQTMLKVVDDVLCCEKNSPKIIVYLQIFLWHQKYVAKIAIILTVISVMEYKEINSFCTSSYVLETQTDQHIYL